MMVETGVPFAQIGRIRISEIMGRDEYHYRSRSGSIRREPISPMLKHDIAVYCMGRDPQEFAFIGKKNKRPVHHSTICQVFSNVSKTLGLLPPMAISTAHKTFIYHMILKDGNVRRAKKYLHAGSVREVYETIGVPMPEKDEEPAPENAKLRVIRSDILRDTSDRADAMFYNIRKRIEDPDEPTEDYCQSVLSFCEEINTLLTKYRFKLYE